MADRHTARRALRTAVVWDVLQDVLARQCAAAARDTLDVVDVGGGTGGFAVPLAGLGHRVTVVDPSPDALAALQRRAAEAALSVRAVQGDASELLGAVGADRADLVLCHGVLEYVDDPVAALAGLAAVLRTGGVASVLAAQRLAAVLARALSGHFAEAQHALGAQSGRWGEGDPLPHRFTEEELTSLLEGAGLHVSDVRGVRVVSDLVAGDLVDAEPGAADALLTLERSLSEHPVLARIASQLHLLAVRG